MLELFDAGNLVGSLRGHCYSTLRAVPPLRGLVLDCS